MANSLTGLLGLDFDELRIQAVWNKGREIPGYHKDEWRYDDDGRLIRRNEYGKTNLPHGWQIDHIAATALGGLDVYGNLRPLHCKGNASRGGLLAALLRK